MQKNENKRTNCYNQECAGYEGYFLGDVVGKDAVLSPNQLFRMALYGVKIGNKDILFPCPPYRIMENKDENEKECFKDAKYELESAGTSLSAINKNNEYAYLDSRFGYQDEMGYCIGKYKPLSPIDRKMVKKIYSLDPYYEFEEHDQVSACQSLCLLGNILYERIKKEEMVYLQTTLIKENLKAVQEFLKLMQTKKYRKFLDYEKHGEMDNAIINRQIAEEMNDNIRELAYKYDSIPKR